MDAVTRARAGSLSAHALSDQEIADILLLSIAQINAIKDTLEFKAKYAEVANAVIQRQVDLEEGWDAVEEKALAQVFQTLEYNRDPRYALIAAKTANDANRRSTKKRDPRVIDNSKPQQNNTVILNLNKNYIVNKTNEAGTNATIDLTPRVTATERKIADLPSPKDVENLLAPVKKSPDKVMSELEKAFEIAGVFKDDEPA